MMFFVVIVSVVCGGVIGFTFGFVIGHIRCSGKIVKMLETVTLALKKREDVAPPLVGHVCSRCQKPTTIYDAHFNPATGLLCGECNAKSQLHSNPPPTTP